MYSTADLSSSSVWSCSEVQTPEVEPAARSHVDMYITRAVADLCFGRQQRAAAASGSYDDEDSYVGLDDLSDICPDPSRRRMFPRSSTKEDFRSISREVFAELMQDEVRGAEYDLDDATSPNSDSGYSTAGTSSESSNFRSRKSLQRVISVASVADSDRTDFMERPMVRPPVTSQRPSKDRRRAIAKSLKRVGRQLFQRSSAKNKCQLETLAVL